MFGVNLKIVTLTGSEASFRLVTATSYQTRLQSQNGRQLIFNQKKMGSDALGILRCKFNSRLYYVYTEDAAHVISCYPNMLSSYYFPIHEFVEKTIYNAVLKGKKKTSKINTEYPLVITNVHKY